LRNKAREGWRFAAFGKHPAAKDYFRLGDTTPLLEGIADWVDKGYEGVEEKKRGMADSASWRFWSKGAGPGALVCGFVRDSVDRLGRPYPLLVLGTGSLREWEGHWDLLPYACMPAWQRMEYLGAQQYEEIGRFESAVRGLPPPVPEWTEYSVRREREIDLPGAPCGSPGDDVTSGKGRDDAGTERPSRFIRLAGEAGSDPLAGAIGWQSRLRRKGAEVPNAVFFGGTLSGVSLGMFWNRLSTSDFGRIWNVTTREEGSMERGAN
jgi:type VI secretion system protein VasJ